MSPSSVADTKHRGGVIFLNRKRHFLMGFAIGLGVSGGIALIFLLGFLFGVFF